MPVQRVDQGMAQAAEAILRGARVTKKLRTRYRQLRPMLNQSGLAATYAFVASKAQGNDQLATAYQGVAAAIRGRLHSQGLLTGDPAHTTHSDVFTALGNADPTDYARASADAAALAGWLSRLADALVVDEE
jgi:CRISPR/Cas system CMR-associated protein Cmr5 small subunit